MEREEKLKAAKEKLKKFQRKKQENIPSESSEPPLDIHDASISHESIGTLNDQGLPLFTMTSGPNGNDFLREDQEHVNNEIQLVSNAMESVEGEKSFDDHHHRSASSLAVGLVNEVPEQLKRNTSERHASLSEQIADVLSLSGTQISESKDDDDSSTVLRQKLHELEMSKTELEQQMRHQASTLLHFQSCCKSMSSKLEVAESKLAEEREAFEVKLEKQKESSAQQLSSHVEAINILVMEKTDLEGMLVSKGDEIAKLKEVKSVEDAKLTSNLVDNVDEAALEALRGDCERYRQNLTCLQQEMTELSSKYASKEEEVKVVRAQLTEVQSRHEMTELNLSQLRSAATSDETAKNLDANKDEEIARLVKDNDEHVGRVNELTAYIQKAAEDREQIIHQYTSYSQQLTGQIEELTKELNDKKVAHHTSVCREADLVAHVQRLEEQLQQLMQQQQQKDRAGDSQAEQFVVKLQEKLSSYVDRVDALEANLGEASRLTEVVQDEKNKAESKVKELTDELVEAQERLSDVETKLQMERMNGGKDVIAQQEDLVAACQSDKIAASRAMTQNVTLKQRLEELELAVIQTTNSKASIASELVSLKQKERQWMDGEKMMALELTSLKEAVCERDRSIGELREQMNHHVNVAGKPSGVQAELEEQVGKLSKELDEAKQLIHRLTSRSCQPNGRNASEENDKVDEASATLAKELEQAKEKIRSLGSHNTELKSQLEVLSMRTTDSSEAATPNGADDDDDSVDQLEVESLTASSVSSHFDVVKNKPLDGIPALSTEVALLKLEQKFREAMTKIANLATEKERLEHIVIQLQDETDTVGEYVTIYQHQRQQHKLRLQEKESQLQALSLERETLKSKLVQLQGLIKTFVQETSQDSTFNQDFLEVGPDMNGSISDGDSIVSTSKAEHSKDELSTRQDLEIAQEAVETETGLSGQVSAGDEEQAVLRLPESEKRVSSVSSSTREEVQPTADKILALISEIGSNQILGDNFHPWFWEPPHGELKTV